jgi:hypothetical protein
MDILFTTDLITNGSSETFEVTFSNEQYHFKGLNSNKSFSIRREEDEWHVDQEQDSNLKNAAIEKLEAYLLSQH